MEYIQQLQANNTNLEILIEINKFLPNCMQKADNGEPKFHNEIVTNTRTASEIWAFLHSAITTSSPTGIRERQADYTDVTSLRNNAGKTSFRLLIDNDRIKVIAEIAKHSAFNWRLDHYFNLNLRDEQGVTDLEYALTNASTEIKNHLIKNLSTKSLLSNQNDSLFHDNTDSLMKLKNFMIKGNLGKGLGGNIEGYMGKIHRLQLGDIHFENMISSIQALNEEVLKEEKVVRNGLLGNMLFERFHVIFDFRNKKLYLKPLKNYNKEFEFDKSGLTVFAYGENLDKFYIKYVIENSPGEIAGLLPGDIILKIGWFSYRWYDLKKVNKILSGKTGKVIKLRIKRGNEILNKEITLKELFESP